VRISYADLERGPGAFVKNWGFVDQVILATYYLPPTYSTTYYSPPTIQSATNYSRTYLTPYHRTKRAARTMIPPPLVPHGPPRASAMPPPPTGLGLGIWRPSPPPRSVCYAHVYTTTIATKDLIDAAWRCSLRRSLSIGPP
jgi:hypothetical protein